MVSVLALVGLAACGSGEQGKDRSRHWGKETTLERACGGIFDAASIRAVHGADAETEKVYVFSYLEYSRAELVKKLASGDDNETLFQCRLNDAEGRPLFTMSFRSSVGTGFPKGATADFRSLVGVLPSEVLDIDCGMPGKAPSLDGLLTAGPGVIDLPVRRAVLEHAGAKIVAAAHCPKHVVFPPVPVFVSG
ncbi:hypothetical protein [Streptomyces montanisoli]|uniref:Uncharacterized protein n=1 Tax=Streptomyces montanisoli TaxID=2798581 RepID=A0A940RXG6_9ACTN|nr:hypothetical protein [Streptomyces montanisoli]MBP0460555.1 hypothetical protein [Streptomyces montanisoli]